MQKSVKKLVGSLQGLKRKLEESQKASQKYTNRCRARLEHIEQLDVVKSHHDATLKEQQAQAQQRSAGSAKRQRGHGMANGASNGDLGLVEEREEDGESKDGLLGLGLGSGLLETPAQAAAREEAEALQQARLVKLSHQAYVRATKTRLDRLLVDHLLREGGFPEQSTHLFNSFFVVCCCRPLFERG